MNTKHNYTVTMSDEKSFDVTLTIDWSNCTEADVYEYAARSIIIREQAKQRSSYSGKNHVVPPTTLTVKPDKPNTRSAKTPEEIKAEIEKLLGRLTPEQRANLLGPASE